MSRKFVLQRYIGTCKIYFEAILALIPASVWRPTFFSFKTRKREVRGFQRTATQYNRQCTVEDSDGGGGGTAHHVTTNSSHYSAYGFWSVESQELSPSSETDSRSASQEILPFFFY
jgi:hypothetical protein